MPISDKDKYNEYTNAHLVKKYQTRRLEFIEYLGGACVRCGTDQGLEFDHINRFSKSFNIAKRMVSMNYEELKLEIDKCQLLCKECHLEKSREAGDMKNVEHGGGNSGKRNCKCEPCKLKKAEYMKSKKAQYQAARDLKRKQQKG